MGKPHTEEWKEMMSKIQKGRKHFPQQGFQKRHPQLNTGRTHFKKGQRSTNWKGGRIIDGYGYIKIYSPDHPACDTKGYIKEHRLIMEKHLGRYLSGKEVVHHIDGNKQNNKIENLKLYKNNGEHCSEHFKSQR